MCIFFCFLFYKNMSDKKKEQSKIFMNNTFHYVICTAKKLIVIS